MDAISSPCGGQTRIAVATSHMGQTVASKAAAERGVKQWIDDRQPKPRRARPQARLGPRSSAY